MTTPLKAVQTSTGVGEIREWVGGDFLPLSLGGTGVAASSLADVRAALGLGSAATIPVVGTVNNGGGATVQTAVTANGYVERWPSGIQICTRSYPISGITTGAPGSGKALGDWTYPASFSAKPIVVSLFAGGYSSALLVGADNVQASAAYSIYISSTISGVQCTGDVYHLAVGRWF